VTAWFSRADLERIAGAKSFARGGEYADAVADVTPTALGVCAQVRGSDTYEVWLGERDGQLVGECDCPFGAEGNFCKHCVAVGLVLLSGGGPTATDGDLDAIAGYLRGLDHTALVELLLDQVRRDDATYRRLSLLAAGGGGAPQVAVLRRRLDDMLRVRGRLDGAGYLARVKDALDAVEALVEQGHAAEARPLARGAVERLVEATGAIEGAGIERAATRALRIYARACAAARPDPAKLATWLFQLETGEPGLAHVELERFADVLGDTGLTTYRGLVAAAWDADPGRPALWLMRRRLAELSGDVDAVVALHAEELPYPAAYERIVAALRDAGRLADAITWAERGVEETAAATLVDTLVESYVEAGRVVDAIAARRTELHRNPSRATYARLREIAGDRWERERTWARQVLRSAADRDENADELVGALLDDGDVDDAWQAAGKYGCGDRAWLAVAREYATHEPAAVLAGYREVVERTLATASRESYRDAARQLTELAAASEQCGQRTEFTAYLALLRQRHSRRRALQEELTKAGLP
jgi:uncharacterized Zn finger protein